MSKCAGTRRGNGTNRVALLLWFSVSRGLALFGSILGLGSICSAVGGSSVSIRLALFARAFLWGALFLLFLLFLFCRLCNLDNKSAAIELLLVEEVYGLLSCFGSVEGNKAIASRTGATKDDLGREATRSLTK